MTPVDVVVAKPLVPTGRGPASLGEKQILIANLAGKTTKVELKVGQRGFVKAEFDNKEARVFTDVNQVRIAQPKRQSDMELYSVKYAERYLLFMKGSRLIFARAVAPRSLR